MSAPVGSLKDLQDLLQGRGGYVFEPRPFAFYSALMYAAANGLNEKLHNYVVSHYEFFNAQTGPNWLVAVVEDIGREQSIEKFKPQQVYEIARYLGVPVDDIPAIVFFTEPETRNETLVLRLSDVLPEPGEIKEENLTMLFGKIAAIIDNICQTDAPSDARLKVLREALSREWPESSTVGAKLTSAIGWLKVSAATATTVLGAIDSLVKLLKATGLY